MNSLHQKSLDKQLDKRLSKNQSVFSIFLLNLPVCESIKTVMALINTVDINICRGSQAIKNPRIPLFA
jgi:hypothetical protein